MFRRIVVFAVVGLVGVYAVLAAIVYLNPATKLVYDTADPKAVDFTYANGLTPADRAAFYHTSQGAEILPIRYLRAMEDPATGKPFMENLGRFGLLPDPDRSDGLAVGITLSDPPNPLLGRFAGITCAACHVGEFRVGGKGVRVDGAPNMFDMQAFYEAMLKAGDATLADHGRFDRTLERLIRQDLDQYGVFGPVVRVWFWINGAEHAASFRRDLQARLDLMKVIKLAIETREANAKPGEVTTSGFGRLDAFNGTRNFLLGRVSTKNLVPLAAPVKFPPIWSFGDYEWIEWTQNTNSVLARNVTETLGAGATVNIEPSFGARRFESTVPVRNLHRLELTAYKLSAPAWPAGVFGAPDAAAAARGGLVFAARCAGCHEYGPKDRTPTGLIRLRVFSPADLGVDDSTARQVAAPLEDIGDLPLKPGDRSFASAVSFVVGQITAKAYAAANVGPDEQAAMEDRARRGGVYWRDTIIATGKPYAARPLHGVWAMAPYLHNGSVPTIWDLMQPPDKRPVRFPIGHRDYDPVKLGFRTDIPEAQAKYVVDTRKAGNANTGHTFGAALTDDQRRDLIEFLKTY
jgi:hypothetical protein